MILIVVLLRRHERFQNLSRKGADAKEDLRFPGGSSFASFAPLREKSFFNPVRLLPVPGFMSALSAV